LTDISACGPYPYGEVEDYCVHITDYSSGIFTETENHFVTVYPNPLTDFLTFQKHFDYELPFSIIDCNGRKVYSSVLQNDIQTIDLSELAAGMYFLKAGNQVLKLVKS
jgi:hypothetical protein